jgi:TrkA domain protein
MPVRETLLPGIGRRYEVDAGRSRVVTVVHNTGRRDLYVFGGGEPEPTCGIQLDDAEARRLGAILGGTYFAPIAIEGVEDVVGKLMLDWTQVPEGSPAAGRTIEELKIRTETGMTVIGIGRGATAITSPRPSTRLRAGDRVVAAGPVNGMGKFLDLIGGG